MRRDGYIQDNCMLKNSVICYKYLTYDRMPGNSSETRVFTLQKTYVKTWLKQKNLSFERTEISAAIDLVLVR